MLGRIVYAVYICENIVGHSVVLKGILALERDAYERRLYTVLYSHGIIVNISSSFLCSRIDHAASGWLLSIR